MGKKAKTSSNPAATQDTSSLFKWYELISNSGLFDPAFYLEKNPDVAQFGLDPLAHFLEYGAQERRSPHPGFDTEYYLQQCAERHITTGNVVLHYLLEGKSLGLSPRRGGAPVLEEASHHAAAYENQGWMIQLAAESGLFDRAFYNQSYGFRFDSDGEALQHFFSAGVGEGKRPNLYFDPAWYLNTYPDLREARVQPLHHFLIQGESEGRRPSPLFDPGWYRATYHLAAGEHTLAHYLKNRTSCDYSPIPEFDAVFYGDVNKDVRAAGVDPFEHFLLYGYREGRNPSARFNIKYYSARYLRGSLQVNPFLHYLEHKHEPGVYGSPPPDEVSVPRAVKHYAKPAAEFEAFKPLPQSAERKAKVLAYYLPQFHAFPENDAWWGKGFTEWTNIARGVSRFRGHYQPRIPRDLGFYSLEDALPTLRRQVELAKGGGVHGFVFYYYWFNGKRLMERPVEQFLGAPDIDMPFALMWANENWTRRWDGDEHEVLISQDYDPADDEALAADFVRHFRDSRYIRVQGRPLMMIYRPGSIPKAREAIQRWRKLFREQFSEDPIIVMAQAFDDFDPAVHGFDGAIEFPPHKLTAHMRTANDQLEYLDVEFNGKVFSYDDVVAHSLEEPAPAFPLIKTAVPSWDNDARRQGTGLVMSGSTPAKYEAWMSRLVENARRHTFFGEPFVCVNAWNEWCEAAYLEPDLHYGSAYLNATGRAVAGLSRAASVSKLLLVGHDAFPSGAQHLLLNIARRLIGEHGVQVEFLLLSGGAMAKAYEEVAPLTVASDAATLNEMLDAAKARGFADALVNTVAATQILPLLKSRGIEALSLVHELPRIVREKHLQVGAKSAFELSRNLVFASPVVRDLLAAELGVVPDRRVRILPQGMYQSLQSSAEEGAAVRREFGIAEGDKLVLGVGYADLRKGFDLFLQLWRQLNQEGGQRVHCCWVGDIDPGLKDWLSLEVKAAAASGSFHMAGYRKQVAPFLAVADAFALTSREDAFPTVVHEALDAGLPVFVFADAGGMPEFLAQHRMGTIAPYADVITMARQVASALTRTADRAEARRRREFVRTQLDFGHYVDQLLRLALPRLPCVSVAVPNYNYARFMPGRLSSVFRQSHAVEEILVLDDGSTDDSLEVIPRVAAEWGRKVSLLPNAVNSGSVFAQWRKAAQAARGEFLWIAEADDLSEPAFLAAVVGAMQEDPTICLGFSDSSTVHYDGSPQWSSYKGYYAQQEPGALTESATWDGAEFVSRYLAVRNLILNVSAVVWRREALLRALDACQADLQELRMAGDWRLYLETLVAPGARVAYVADPLNVHRRHAESVTHALKAELHLAEIARCQAFAAKKLRAGAKLRGQQEKYLSSIKAQLMERPLAVPPAAKSRKARRAKA
jgi:glycosyltransferase involved in cell wall biosynthesis